MTGISTFFNARHGIRRPQLHSLGIPTLRASRKPSVGARLARNRRPSGECRIRWLAGIQMAVDPPGMLPFCHRLHIFTSCRRRGFPKALILC